MKSLLWEGVVRFMESIWDHDKRESGPNNRRSPSAAPSRSASASVPLYEAICPASQSIPHPPAGEMSLEVCSHLQTALGVSGQVCDPQPEAAGTEVSMRISPLRPPSRSVAYPPHHQPVVRRTSSRGGGARERRERELEGTIAQLFRRFCYGQAVVIGELPPLLPRAEIFMISPEADVPPYGTHVRCEACPEEWPSSLALMGFEEPESTVWLLRLQNVSDAILMDHLKAAADMSAPCSVVLLVSWSTQAVDIADKAGFSMDVVQYGSPLYLLRRKERRAQWGETDSLYTSPMYSPPPEPVVDGREIQFGLELDGMCDELRRMLAAGCAKVVGNCTALGEWDVKRGVRMEVFNGLLFSEVIVEEENVEYKYVVEHGSGALVWEAGENRRVLVDGEVCTRQEDRWRR